MTPKKIPHLCGGILFGLLYEAKKPRRKARDKLKGGSDGLTIPGMYAGFINIVTGEDLTAYAGTSLKKCATNYRKCEDSTGEYVPFTKPATQSSFDSQYKRKDPDLFKRTSRFIETYLNKAKCEWLVRALIETMQAESIDTEIAISYKDQKSVSDLDKTDHIQFLPFLLSVIHYVMMNCPDCESGRPTFESWYSQSSSRSEWKFHSNIGCSISPMNVDVDLSIPETSDRSSAGNVPIKPITDDLSDREVIANNLTKDLSTLAKAIDVNNHQIAERIRQNQKKQTSSTEDNTATDKADRKTESKRAQNITIIQNQKIVEHDNSKTFNIDNSDVTFNL